MVLTSERIDQTILVMPSDARGSRKHHGESHGYKCRRIIPTANTTTTTNNVIAFVPVPNEWECGKLSMTTVTTAAASSLPPSSSSTTTGIPVAVQSKRTALTSDNNNISANATTVHDMLLMLLLLELQMTNMKVKFTLVCNNFNRRY